MIAGIQSWLLHLHGPIVYLVVALLVFLESAIIIGFFIPGEIASIIGGVIASQHHANVVVMVVVVIVAASVGNVAGYELGAVLGPWLTNRRPLRGNAGLARTERLIAQRGAPAVFVGRWIAVVRAVIPGVAGMSRMQRPSFAAFATSAAVLWGITWVSVGYAAGLSYAKVASTAGRWAFVALVVVLVGVAIVVVWRRHHPPSDGPSRAPIAPPDT